MSKSGTAFTADNDISVDVLFCHIKLMTKTKAEQIFENMMCFSVRFWFPIDQWNNTKERKRMATLTSCGALYCLGTHLLSTLKNKELVLMASKMSSFRNHKLET